MRMQVSRITDSSSDTNSCSPQEFEMSGVLSEWLFAIGFWRKFNAAHGTMFDQFEEDDADETIVRAVGRALSDLISFLDASSDEVIEFAYRKLADGSSVTASVTRTNLTVELERLSHFLLQSAERHSTLTFSL